MGLCFQVGHLQEKYNPGCHGHKDQVDGRVEFGFSAENTAEVSDVPQFPCWCVGTVSFLHKSSEAEDAFQCGAWWRKDCQHVELR